MRTLRSIVDRAISNCIDDASRATLVALASNLQGFCGADAWHYVPVRDLIVIARDLPTAQVGVIHLATQAQEAPNTGTVIALGPDVPLDPPLLGARVCFPPFAAPSFSISNDPKAGRVMLLPYTQLLGIVIEDTPPTKPE